MKKQLTADHRGRISEKLMEWANLVFVGLVIGQVFSNRFDGVWAIVGIVLFVAMYTIAITFMKGGV